MTKSCISIIVAHSKNMAIGKDNSLIWHMPDDLKRFKKLTTGHPCIMGRKTWESIPEKFRPLSERTNIIVTRNQLYSVQGAIVAKNMEEAIEKARGAGGGEEIFIIGGAKIYKEALPLADRLYITKVDVDTEGDVFFPEYSNVFTKKISEEFGESEGLKYSFAVLEKEK